VRAAGGVRRSGGGVSSGNAFGAGSAPPTVSSGNAFSPIPAPPRVGVDDADLVDRSTAEAEAEDATDELATLLLDDLAPTLQWYRDEVARRLGLSHAELLCLELCRRHGSVTSNRIGERLGLTRSAVWKLLRRLEAAGHVARTAALGREREAEVRLRPHRRRDARRRA
jgi:DNA-binding MarR family transcriptional regulator